MMLVLVTTLAAQVYPSALETGARASLRAETRGGEMSDGAAPTGTGDLELTPRLRLVGRDAELMAFDATYSPSLMFKSHDRGASPLVLHELGLTLVSGDRRGDALMLHLSAFSGPLDYNRAARNLAGDGTITALPVGGLVSYTNADAMVALVRQQTRRLRLEGDLGIGYTGPSITDQVPGLIARQLRAYAVGTVNWLATRRTTLGAAFTVSGVSFQLGSQYLGIAPTLSLGQRLGHATSLTLRGGAQLTRTYPGANSTPAQAGGEGVQPVASAAVETTLPFSRRTALTLQARGEVAPFYDIFEAELLTRAIGTFLAELGQKRGPAVRLRAQWYEPFSSGGPPGPAYDAVEDRLAALAASALAPLRRDLKLEAGVVGLHRWARGAPLSRLAGAPEWLAFASLTYELDLGEVEARPTEGHHGGTP